MRCPKMVRDRTYHVSEKSGKAKKSLSRHFIDAVRY